MRWLASVAAYVLCGATCAWTRAGVGVGATHDGDPDWPKDSYLAVPLKGTIGDEVTAPGVRDALRHAADNKIGHVLLYFETPGGVVADGLAIARVIHDKPEGVKVHAVVEEAYSAAMWPLVECDAVWVLPGGRMGAAVAFRVNPDTGSAEVDRKLIAALATRLGALAEAHGMPSALFKAMVDMKAQVWVQRAIGEKPKITGEKPDAKDVEARCIDDENSVVALDATQAVEFGVATRAPGELRQWSDLAGDKGASGKDGTRFMKAAATKITRERKAYDRALESLRETDKLILEQAKFIKSEAGRAADADPSTLTVRYRESSGTLTPESQLEWKNKSDECLGLWNSVSRAAGELESAVKSFRTKRSALQSAEKKLAKVALWEEDKGAGEGEDEVEAMLEEVSKFASGARETSSKEIERVRKERTRYRIEK